MRGIAAIGIAGDSIGDRPARKGSGTGFDIIFGVVGVPIHAHYHGEQLQQLSAIILVDRVLVAHAIVQVEDHRRVSGNFEQDIPEAAQTETAEMRYMGQDLTNPPTVEGGHTGKEWIDSGTLVERINFTADQVGNVKLPGVRAIIDCLAAEGPSLSAEGLVDGCLKMLGHYELPDDTYGMLLSHVEKNGAIRTDADDFDQRVGQTLQLIVATQEYLFA